VFFDLASGELLMPGTKVRNDIYAAEATKLYVQAARAAIDRLAAVPTDPGFMLHEVAVRRLRALVARAEGDEAAYRHFAAGYLAAAESCGFDGHLAIASAMT
jgi:hypothetical protein